MFSISSQLNFLIKYCKFNESKTEMFHVSIFIQQAKETRSREPKTDVKKFESPSAYFRVEDRCDYDDYDDSNPDDEYFDEEILK